MWSFFDDACERIKKKAENILDESGYPWEEHEVTTEDGYIISMYRIPYSRQTNNNELKGPVLLGHGMSCSSAIFYNGSKLAYHLADEGFDVWMPNNRGTTFSRKHVTLNSKKDQKKYWNFSWHEIGYYDMPAVIDYVIERTGFKKLYYIGHSQGTTAYAVLASERPEYNEKIALSCLLGSAIATNYEINSFILRLWIYVIVPLLMIIDRYLFRINEIKGTGLLRSLSVIPSTSFGRYIYLRIFFLIAGNPNFDQSSEFDYNTFLWTSPNSLSIRQVFHYTQIFQNNRFAKYDYGEVGNLQKYGSTIPPEYNLSNIISPVALFYGKNDMYNDHRKITIVFLPYGDILKSSKAGSGISQISDKLDEKMPNVVLVHVVEHDLFNHGDFLLAKDSVSLLYQHVVKIMRKYQPV